MQACFLVLLLACSQGRFDVEDLLKRLASPDQETRMAAAKSVVGNANDKKMPIHIGKVMLQHGDVKMRRLAVNFFESRTDLGTEAIGWLAEACLKETDSVAAYLLIDLLRAKGGNDGVMAVAERLKNCESQVRRASFVYFLRDMAEGGYDLGEHVEKLTSLLDQGKNESEKVRVACTVLSALNRSEKQTKRAAEYLWSVYEKKSRPERLIYSQYLVHLDDVKPKVMKDLIEAIEKEDFLADSFRTAVRSASYAVKHKKKLGQTLEARLKKERASGEVPRGIGLLALVCLYMNPDSKDARAVLNEDWNDVKRTLDRPSTDPRYVEITLEVLAHFKSREDFPHSQIERLAFGPYVAPTIQRKAKELLKKVQK